MTLKNKDKFPYNLQYLIKPEAKWGLKPLIDKFLKHGLLISDQSPCNTLILPMVKPNGE
jgi:hypothetical protein